MAKSGTPSSSSGKNFKRSGKAAWIIVPVIIAVIWNVLDANPSLFLYDKILSSIYSMESRFEGTWSNSTVWVTGASSGIGAQAVCQLFQAKARHVILSSRSQGKMTQVAQRCQRLYPNSLTTFSVVYYDASDVNNVNATKETVRNALTSTPDGHQSIDVLILNSGIYQIQPAMETSIEQTRKIMQVNYQSPVELSMELMKQDKWKERGSGHLVVVASLMARGPVSLCTTYAASKAALKNYFQSLSTEEFTWLRVNLVLPGATKTDMWEHTGTDTRPDPGTLMEPQRVAHLLLTAAMGPYWLFYEVWVCKCTGLLYICMSLYTPTIFYAAVHIIGLIRRSAYEASNMDMLELMAIVKKLLLLPIQR